MQQNPIAFFSKEVAFSQENDGGLIKSIFVYLMFFLPSEYLCTPSVEENIIQLPFSTVTSLQKNKFFDKLKTAEVIPQRFLICQDILYLF